LVSPALVRRCVKRRSTSVVDAQNEHVSAQNDLSKRHC
jgi:hypothetical protein